jgi:hypothetical protein
MVVRVSNEVAAALHGKFRTGVDELSAALRLQLDIRGQADLARDECDIDVVSRRAPAVQEAEAEGHVPVAAGEPMPRGS